jgi:photosystem II stability/assembly factor-like uncharacterized protein
MKKKVSFIICLTALLFLNNDQELREVILNNRFEEPTLSGPEEIARFHHDIRTPVDREFPEYPSGHLVKEFNQMVENAKVMPRSAALSNGVLEWKERGPNNVPGRTRAILVDPDDPTRESWFAGSASGGVWKTLNGGRTWTLITGQLPHLACSAMVMGTKNTKIIYIGTGEGIGGLGSVGGNGIFKSIDKGQTWNFLNSSSGMGSVNRMIINPADDNQLVVATNTGIYRTTDGGINWTRVYNQIRIQDLRATPGNFNIQYATEYNIGVLKSTDGGITWNKSSNGLVINGRIELDVSPLNPNKLFASAESNIFGVASALFFSDNAAESWSPVIPRFNNQFFDFLGGQGWWNNTVLCDPIQEDGVYVGGVNLFYTQVTSNSNIKAYVVPDEGKQISLVNFGATWRNLEVGSGENKSIILKFGLGKKQKAHRFTVPSNGGSNSDGGAGIPDSLYFYQDYIDIPFEVWERDEEGREVRKLMVSFRDQKRDGQFNLNIRNDTNDPQLLNNREYIFIHYLPYDEQPSPEIARPGGIAVERMYFFWPLQTSDAWNVNSLPSINFRIDVVPAKNSLLSVISDAYRQFTSVNPTLNIENDFHPDQHNILAIKGIGSNYSLLVANDGGLFLSNSSTTPGIRTGDWSKRGLTYRTTQFYGADKRPGFDQYFGGTQDNGTWLSPDNMAALETTNYRSTFGGDGFEVIWNNLDDKKMIGGSQNNRFRRSINGGTTWTLVTTGLSGNHPFVSKLANSKANPDRIYTLSSDGVFYSENFGENWKLTGITEKWGGVTSTMDVEVSQANANIVWAGSGMVNSGTLRNIHVSTDAGETFKPTNNYASVPLGGITKLASHPKDEKTAYALFSFFSRPKILRTTNLGETWEDISGFENGGPVSSRGFPNVAVYCLYVRPDNPNIIWAGTEFGIVQSLDNGESWNIVQDFPPVSVWDMKGQDDQVVIATYGRGIWTAKINAGQHLFRVPEIIASGTAPNGNLALRVAIPEAVDKIDVLLGNQYIGSLPKFNPSQIAFQITGINSGPVDVKFVAYKGNAPFHTKTTRVNWFQVLSVENNHEEPFAADNAIFNQGLRIGPMSGSVAGDKTVLRTNTPYSHNFDYFSVIRHPIRVADQNALVFYEDVALVEPINDYVVVEATKNGLDWIALTPKYDARKNTTWLNTYNIGGQANKSMFVRQEVNLRDKFQPGDSILLRFNMKTNATIAGWGWGINYVSIQPAGTNVRNQATDIDRLHIFPNPASELVQLDFNLLTSSDIWIQLIDFSGKTVLSRNIGKLTEGRHIVPIELTGLPSGQFVVQVITNQGFKTGLLICN